MPQSLYWGTTERICSLLTYRVAASRQITRLSRRSVRVRLTFVPRSSAEGSTLPAA